MQVSLIEYLQQSFKYEIDFQKKVCNVIAAQTASLSTFKYIYCTLGMYW